MGNRFGGTSRATDADGGSITSTSGSLNVKIDTDVDPITGISEEPVSIKIEDGQVTLLCIAKEILTEIKKTNMYLAEMLGETIE